MLFTWGKEDLMFQHISRCSLDFPSTRQTAHWRQIRNASAVLLQREIPEYINEAQLNSCPSWEEANPDVHGKYHVWRDLITIP